MINVGGISSFSEAGLSSPLGGANAAQPRTAGDDFATVLGRLGALVDADMNEESTKLQALQVQQQLGVQSLSIANQNSQNILSLFKG